MKKLQRGVLIALEGIDGAGKTTLIDAIYRYFSQYIATIKTKEPGGTSLGKLIGNFLYNTHNSLNAKAEYLLFAADRAQHFNQVVLPALDNKQLVISDRLADSSIAYQGFGRQMDINMLYKINQWAMNGRNPDLVLYIALDSDTAIERCKKRTQNLSSFEQEKAIFFKKVITGFTTIFNNKNNVITLNGTQTTQEITQQAITAINSWLTTHELISK